MYTYLYAYMYIYIMYVCVHVSVHVHIQDRVLHLSRFAQSVHCSGQLLCSTRSLIGPRSHMTASLHVIRFVSSCVEECSEGCVLMFRLRKAGEAPVAGHEQQYHHTGGREHIAVYKPIL